MGCGDGGNGRVVLTVIQTMCEQFSFASLSWPGVDSARAVFYALMVEVEIAAWTNQG